MPLFECSKCGVVENTALSNGSWRHLQEGKPLECSQCHDGKWHGEFPRVMVKDTDYVTRGWQLEPPGGWPKPGEPAKP